MYGLVNQALQGLVLTSYGAPAWQAVAERAGVQSDTFLAMSPYPDELTYRLTGAAAEVLDRPVEEILIAFGEFWVTYSADQGYGELLDLMGSDLPSFLLALDDLHDRLRLSYPELDPPSIWCSDVTPESLVVHYASSREGLNAFVVGLLQGTARRFGERVQVNPLRGRATGHDHEEFLVLRSLAA
jgi:hypothetical protein